MHFVSTRGQSLPVSAARAIVSGLAPDGGLYTPESFPSLSILEITALLPLGYTDRAAYVMSLFLSEDFSYDTLREFTSQAYGFNKFGAQPCPVSALSGGMHVLELWHGPTCAFKDMALQMLPRLMLGSQKNVGEEGTALILTATSGDTGKAALEAFANIPGTEILVFYPKDGTSRMQALQMVTQEGDNVGVFSVLGNFDDAQTAVKTLFTDEEVRGALRSHGRFFSSANSINLGRLLPQVAYYVSAYCDMVSAGSLDMGQEIDICVPTGNFGNILAALFARTMGLPVRKLLCASNQNDVLTEFLQTGRYNARRPFFTTSSPSMDILISSNLERALFHLSHNQPDFVRDCMSTLGKEGHYELSSERLDVFRSVFHADTVDADQTLATIADVFAREHYLLDPHTAVAFCVAERYRAARNSDRPMLICSTASPFKFSDAVLQALSLVAPDDEFEKMRLLSEHTGQPIPKPLAELQSKPVRFTQSLARDELKKAVDQFLSK